MIHDMDVFANFIKLMGDLGRKTFDFADMHGSLAHIIYIMNALTNFIYFVNDITSKIFRYADLVSLYWI